METYRLPGNIGIQLPAYGAWDPRRVKTFPGIVKLIQRVYDGINMSAYINELQRENIKNRNFSVILLII
jgi:hypothetical protein